jgi:hypothetical protein
MNKLEKYAIRRIIFLANIMDRQRNMVSDGLQQKEVNNNEVQNNNILFNHAHDEIREITNCLLD